jgi:nucleoside-diphosphate-sugar epimerase
MKKKILITGASGFVGSQVIKNLLANNKEVYAIVRKEKKNLLKKKYSNLNLIITNDLFAESSEWWIKICKGVHTIIHLAWYLEPGKYLNSPKNINCLKGSLNMAQGVIKAGVKRFIGIGTCFEYDLSLGKLSINTMLKPSTIYSATKISLYTTLSKLFADNSIEFAWCRLFYLYGEGEDSRRFVPYLHTQLSAGRLVKLSSGKQIRDFMNVSEVGRIIYNIALGNKQGPINICSGKPITIREMAQKIADKYNKRNLLKFGARPDNLIDPPRIVGVPNFKSKSK